MGEGKQTVASDRLGKVQAFLKAYGDFQVERFERERDNAPRHNLITLLDLQRYEVWLHSPFLADLLDPYGTHGQGSLFLKKFLSLLGEKEEDRENERDRPTFKEIARNLAELPGSWDWQVRREVGKIDISILSRKHGVAIFIENKIDALDQDKQLENYGKRLGGFEARGYRTRALVYLSKMENNKPTSGQPDIRLTYRDDIRPWIKSCCITAPRLRENLCQYLEAIDQLVEPNMQDDKLVDFLSKEENVEAAFAIGATLPAIRAHLQEAFWGAVREGFNGLSQQLKVEPDMKNGPAGEGSGIYCGFGENRPRLMVSVWVSSGILHAGVHGDFEKGRSLSDNEWKLFEKIPMIKKSFSRQDETGWCEKYDAISSDEFLTEVAIDKKAAAARITGALFNLLENGELLELHKDICKLGVRET
ncbi:MAG: PD-(D/E)XK nuclease family protein [Alphaproteobacteria bacterium]